MNFGDKLLTSLTNAVDEAGYESFDDRAHAARRYCEVAALCEDLDVSDFVMRRYLVTVAKITGCHEECLIGLFGAIKNGDA